jgi:hypothetical protein
MIDFDLLCLANAGTIPTEIGFLTGLVEGLLLSTNRFSHPVPTELGQLSALTGYFYFGNVAAPNSGRNSSHPPFQSSPCVHMLRALVGVLPTELGRLTSLLNGFALTSSSFSGKCLTRCQQSCSLVRRTRLLMIGLIPSELGQLTALNQYFHLSGNAFTGPNRGLTVACLSSDC